MESSEEVYANEVVYDASQFETFKNRTKQEIADKYQAAYYAGKTYINGDSSTYYSTEASTKNPYNKGVLSDDTQKVLTAYSNYFRWLTGANDLQVSSNNKSGYAEAMQAQALDRNFEFNHYISQSSKPADMSDEIWNEGFNCTHNILAKGYTPAGAINGWLEEGYSLSSSAWDTLGHRNAIIDPSVSNIQYGYCGSVCIGKRVESRNAYKEAFTAYPAPGYMPSEQIYPATSAWSVYLDASKVKATSPGNVVIMVKNLTKNTSYTCSNSDSTARVSTSNVVFVQPSDYTNSEYTDKYQITITGLTDVKTGGSATITYTVEFFEVEKLVKQSPVYKVKAAVGSVCVGKQMTTVEDMKKVAAIIPTDIVLTSDTGVSATVKAVGAWKYDAENDYFVNSVSSSGLPSTMNDNWNKLTRIVLKYSKSGGDYFLTTFTPKASKAGGSTTVDVYHYYSSAGYTTGVSKIKLKSDGDYSIVKSYIKGQCSEYDSDKSGYYDDYYNFSSVDSDIAGEYISYFYNSSSFYVNAPTTFEIRNNGYVERVYSEYAKVYVASSFTEEDLKKTAAILPKTVYAVSDIGDVVELSVSGNWTLNTEKNNLKIVSIVVLYH